VGGTTLNCGAETIENAAPQKEREGGGRTCPIDGESGEGSESKPTARTDGGSLLGESGQAIQRITGVTGSPYCTQPGTY